MPIRTTKPFTLGSFDVPQPAGTYRVVTEEEVMEGMSSPACARHSTTLRTPAVSAMASLREAFPVDTTDLEADALGVAPHSIGTGSTEE